MKFLLLALALVAVLLLAGNAARADTFAASWANWYNAQAAAHHDDLTITAIRCALVRRGVYTGAHVCHANLRFKGARSCERLVVTGDGTILAARPERCGSALLALWWQSEGVSRRHPL